MAKTQYLTKEGLDSLKKELEYLKTEKRKEISERIRHTAAFGDLKENAAYHEAKEAQGFLESKIAELRELIRNSVVADTKKKDVVQLGSTVEIKEGDSASEKYKIVGSVEANPLEGKLSIESPFGKKIIGLKEGDVFEFEGSDGKMKYKIIKIT